MGATIQLLNMVRNIGFGFLISLRSSDSWRLSTAGYIMRKRQMPMGTLIPRICHAFNAILRPGMTWLRMSPVAMHAATQTARYFSKVPRLFSSVTVIQSHCV